jgi:hypothetical protein
MSRRYVWSVGLAAAIAVLALVASPVVGQAPGQKASAQWPKTPWGDPDLQGTWNFGTITPLERPAKYGNREFLTPEEVAQLNKESSERASSERRSQLTAQEDVDLAYDQFWWDRGNALNRTSLITDPPDGRLPFTDEGHARRAAQNKRGFDSWEDRSLSERCIVYRPVPVRSTGYNNNNVIVQAPGYVAMYQEQIHEVRIIPLDGRPHLGKDIRPWLGDSRGHWEGNTFVVETTNFNPKTAYEGSGGNRTVIERFVPVDAKTLSYEFTVTDPTTWTRPWTAKMPWRRTTDQVFEYACHEGNYAMVHMLAGARVQEKKAQAKQSSHTADRNR